MTSFINNPKGIVPGLPKLKERLQVCHGMGVGAVAYFIAQIVHTSDELVVIRSIASAIATIFEDNSANIIGSPRPIEKLQNEESLDDDKVSPESVLDLGFDDAEPVTKQEVVSIAAASVKELAGVIAMYCWTASKSPNDQNKRAFDDLRAKAVKARILGDLLIFGQNSNLLSLSVLVKTAATFSSLLPHRANLFTYLALRTTTIIESSGAPLVLLTFIYMQHDVGVGQVRIIEEAVEKFPRILERLPQLKAEFILVQAAGQYIRSLPAPTRSFVKTIYADAYVPVPPNAIQNLFGVAKFALSLVSRNYENYSGGTILESQRTAVREIVEPSIILTPDNEENLQIPE